MSEVKRYDIKYAGEGEFRAAMSDENGPLVSYSDYAELKAQRDALAAENSGLKFVQKGLVKLVSEHLEDASLAGAEMKTPATDAYLNSVRAEGVESFAHHQRVIADAMPEHGCQRGRRFAAGLAEDFAAQLRAGKDGE